MPRVPDLECLDNVWLWGEPGTGKSYELRRRYPNAYPKAFSKWWDGYAGESAILIDDFERSDLTGQGLPQRHPLAHHLKLWADAYEFLAESKGSAMRIRPAHILVSSNYSIDDVFGYDPCLCAAIHRRFHEQHWTMADRVAEVPVDPPVVAGPPDGDVARRVPLVRQDDLIGEGSNVGGEDDCSDCDIIGERPEDFEDMAS